jgi:hypothetical protein
MVDKVYPIKLESIATGGGQDDFSQSETNPDQDYIGAKGISLEANDNQLIDIDGSGNLQFEDTVTGVVTLASLVGGGGLTPTTHKDLDQLVHDIAETSYTEVTYTSNRPTDIIIWTSVAKATKIRECNLTYTGGLVTTAVTKQYDGSGVLVETLTSTPSYTGGIINNITQTLT